MQVYSLQANQNGFTLVEVLIVILVMGILADLSIGFFSNKMVNDRLKIVNRALPLLSC
tara:strand:+ start:268 stop:441 length:174 start_codon:yes stop_codon:yes gene_type:complete